jgi:hypothetical protein
MMPSPLIATPEQDWPARLTRLKQRTLLVALMVLLAACFGLSLLADPLGQLIAHGYNLLLRQEHLPLAHVPLAADGLELPQLAFLLISAMAIVGFSLGLFRQLSARVVALPPLAVGLITLLFLPSTSQWLHIVPSKLERNIMHGRFDAAEQIVTELHLSAPVRNYVQAQIALRAHDKIALQRFGEPVLTLADQFAYRQPVGAQLKQADLDSVVLFRPEVIHAIDLALNGAPQTEVGIQWQASTRSATRRWSVLAGQLLGGIALLATSLALMPVWNAMRRRVRRVQAELATPRFLD